MSSSESPPKLASATDARSAAAPVDLARQGDFKLGALTVRPSLGQVSDQAGTRRLQPRVMQVLVALHRAGGEVVSRDDLLASCWGGLALGDDVINRCIGQLRRLAEDGDGAFAIETIPRVGYRLVTGDPGEGGEGRADTSAPLTDSVPGGEPRRFDRRIVLGGALGATALLAGGAWVATSLRPRRSPEVQALYDRGEAAFQQGSPNDNAQAIGFFEKALEKAPNDVDVIGALALAYRFEQGFGSPNNLAHNTLMTDATVARCLAIDPRNRDGLAAQALILPFAGRWREGEVRLRAGLAKLPDDGLLLTFLGKVLAAVGRNHEAVGAFSRAGELERYVPLIRDDLVNALFATGQIDKADRAIDDASSLWPRDAKLWWTRFWLYVHTGRASAAFAHIESPAGHPVEVDLDAIQIAKAVAASISDKSDAKTAAVLSRLHDYALGRPQFWPDTIGLAVDLGQIDRAFEMLGAYYAPYSNPGGQRLPSTNLLFRAPLKPIRGDARFARLTQSVGLDRYWKASGSRPDPV